MKSQKVASAGEWALQINTAWRSTVESIIKVGRLLVEAKEALGHGNFESMVETELPFGSRTAQMLMKIGADERLAKANHGSDLPSSWRTLYELTKLGDNEFATKIADGTINAEMERADIRPSIRVISHQPSEAKSEPAARIAIAHDRRPEPASKSFAVPDKSLLRKHWSAPTEKIEVFFTGAEIARIRGQASRSGSDMHALVKLWIIEALERAEKELEWQSAAPLTPRH